MVLEKRDGQNQCRIGHHALLIIPKEIFRLSQYYRELLALNNARGSTGSYTPSKYPRGFAALP
jgi:hypothetical protein